jgi:diguanylate cyclase (GGDEF)-like protein
MAEEYRTERVYRPAMVNEFAREHEPYRRHLPPGAYAAKAPVKRPTAEDVASVLGLPAHLVTSELLDAILPLLMELERLHVESEHWKRRELWMERQADRHSVVPCLNRRAFMRELEGFLGSGDAHGVVALLQVAGIEALRQLHGLAAGEGALRHVAANLLGCVRGSDLVACVGGSDFAVLLPGTDEARGRLKLDEMVARIKAPPFTWLGQTIPLTVTYGIYQLRRGEGAEQALAAADRSRRGLG